MRSIDSLVCSSPRIFILTHMQTGASTTNNENARRLFLWLTRRYCQAYFRFDKVWCAGLCASGAAAPPRQRRASPRSKCFDFGNGLEFRQRRTSPGVGGAQAPAPPTPPGLGMRPKGRPVHRAPRRASMPANNRKRPAAETIIKRHNRALTRVRVWRRFLCFFPGLFILTLMYAGNVRKDL